jgi:hypothetical protein
MALTQLFLCSIAPARPRPKPRRVVGPISRDSEDNFNLRRTRERARMKSLGSSQRLSPPPSLAVGGQATTTSSSNSAHRDSMNAAAAIPPTISDDHCGSPTVPSSVAEEEEYPSILTQIPNDGYSGQDTQEMGEDETNPDETAFYRITYPNNQGGSHYPGIPPFPGSPSAADRITEIRNEETGRWEHLPPGHCAPRRADGDDRDAQLAMLATLTPVDHHDDECARESSPSGSDYSTARKVKERDRVYRRSRGRPASDTEEEDDQDDNAFAESLAQELSSTHTQRRKLNGDPPPSRFTKEQKGKDRAADDDVDADVGTDEENKGHRKAARGISKEEKSEVDAFAKNVVARAEELADKWNRKPRDILIRAGLGTRLSRGPNTYNDFKAWYTAVHKDERPEGKSSCHSSYLGIYALLIVRSLDGPVERSHHTAV